MIFPSDTKRAKMSYFDSHYIESFVPSFVDNCTVPIPKRWKRKKVTHKTGRQCLIKKANCFLMKCNAYYSFVNLTKNCEIRWLRAKLSFICLHTLKQQSAWFIGMVMVKVPWLAFNVFSQTNCKDGYKKPDIG